MNADYFIKKFEAIPEENWCTGVYKLGDRCCVLGHCGFHTTEDDQGLRTIHAQAPEGIALSELFYTRDLSCSRVNDGEDDYYPQATPKARILAALRDIKETTI